jgi:uncharacterized membrane protein
VSPVPARQPAGGALLRRVRDPASSNLLELRGGPVGRGQVLPRVRSSRCRHHEPPSRSPDSYTPKHLAEKILTSKAALEGERKQVTVLFADLKGSMELLADRDPEEARKILDPVLEHMMEAVHRYESYAILLRLGAGSINPALGALIISGVALPFTAVVFAILRVWHPGAMVTNKGLSLMILAGVAAASTTVFGLLAYARGFKLSSSPIITATQMGVVLLVGFVFLKEPFSIGRLLALILIVLGIVVLQRQGV